MFLKATAKSWHVPAPGSLHAGGEPEEELLSLLSRAQAPDSEDALARIGVCGCHAKASMPSMLCFISSTTACTHEQAKHQY